jgi:hypothetical protein
MAGLVPDTHEHPCGREIMGPRHKAGDDEGESYNSNEKHDNFRK